MPGPNSDPRQRTALTKSEMARRMHGTAHGPAAGCKPGNTCMHQPTKRARKIAAGKTRIARSEWTRKKGH